MMYPHFSDPSYELEITISHSNLSIKIKKRYLKSLQMNISNSYCKKRKHHLHLQSAQFINSLTHLSLSFLFRYS